VSYVYLESFIAIVVGYVLWILLSKLTTPEVIGLSSTIISLSIIFSNIIDLGVSAGSTRFLGKSFSEGKVSQTKAIIKASLLISFSSMLVCSGIIFIFRDLIYHSIEFELIIISIFLIAISVIVNLLRSILIASLETKSLPKIMIIGSVCKIVLAVTLVLSGLGANGITMAYLSSYIAAAVLLTFTLVTLFVSNKKENDANLESTLHACRYILIASIPSWIPVIIGVLGSQLGTVLIFKLAGASQAGAYYIAFSIFFAIDAIRNSLFSVIYPTLSAMHDERKRTVWRFMKICLAVSLPVSSIFILYSNEILALIGHDYLQASIALKIILLSTLPFTLNIGITTLVYSYGNYKKVLTLGLASNVPRILLYFILVPTYGITGAALSFTIGAIIGSIVSILIARIIGMKIFWIDLVIIFSVPMGLVATLYYFSINYLMGILIIILSSLVIYLKFRILSKSDIQDSLAVLPSAIANPLNVLLDKWR